MKNLACSNDKINQFNAFHNQSAIQKRFQKYFVEIVANWCHLLVIERMFHCASSKAERLKESEKLRFVKNLAHFELNRFC